MADMISEADARYALDLVSQVCARVGPGIPASPQERERARMIQQELEAHLGGENVVVEEFTLAPGAFLSTLPGVISMLVAILLNISIGRISVIPSWITSAAALVFALFTPVSFSLEFLLCREAFDRFYPKKESINVIGRLRKPGTEVVKHQLIISGHHDSAFENTWLRYTGYGFFFLSATFVIGAFALVVMCLVQLAGVISRNEDIINAGTLGWVLLVYPILPAMIYALFLTRGKVNGGIVPGAADNLSACGVVVAMCRFLVTHPDFIPVDTEICFISFGSEEAGLRGSKRYVERHLDELKQMDACVLNYEIIAYPQITILVSDVNGTVKNSPQMVNSVVAAAQRAGVPYKIGSASIGAGGDSAPFSQEGIKGTTLLAFKVPQQQMAFYHQDRDTPEVLSIEPIQNMLKLTLEWVRNGGA